MLLVPVVICCALAAVSALAVVLLRRPVHVAVGLLGHSLSMAALYFTLQAQLMAAAQMLIYSGAIVVLFLIVVALLPTGGSDVRRPSQLLAAAAVFGAVAASLAAMLAALSPLPTITERAPTVREVGEPLFTSLIVPFELTAPLLLAAIVAAVVLWRRQEPVDREVRRGETARADAKGGAA